MVSGSSFSRAYPRPAKISIPMLTVIDNNNNSLYEKLFTQKYIFQDYLWLFLKVVPRVLRPVM